MSSENIGTDKKFGWEICWKAVPWNIEKDNMGVDKNKS
jgi:hypothetical protein